MIKLMRFRVTLDFCLRSLVFFAATSGPDVRNRRLAELSVLLRANDPTLGSILDVEVVVENAENVVACLREGDAAQH